MTLSVAWPAPESVPIIGNEYQTPDGRFPRVTKILKVLGLSTNSLVAWSANQERSAVLDAVASVFVSGDHEDGPAGFLAAVGEKLGPARAHQKILEKSGDIGTEIHLAINHRVRVMLGLPVGPDPVLSAPAQAGLDSWQTWWNESGLFPIRTEQPIWHPSGYAGTIDLIASRDGELEIIDFKTGKAIYLEHHLQGMAYLKAARNWAPVRTVNFLRLPKRVEDGFQVVPLGVDNYSKRTFTEDELWTAFQAAVVAHRILMKP